MKVFVLTSSRADYGIYLPLLKALDAHGKFDLNLIVFGTHLSKFHGYTIQNIYEDGFKIRAEIDTVLANDSEESIATSMGLTSTKFAAFWKNHQREIDLVFCLGDRYEMFAAVASSVPFNIPIAHLHGGETTLGAIDDKFRHAITLFSKYHFTATEVYAKRVEELTENNKFIWNVGALSLDNLESIKLLNKDEFNIKFKIDLNIPTILVTIHPETVALEKNREYVQAAIAALSQILNSYQVVITMPNADTAGNIIREQLLLFGEQHKRVILIENFGTQGYFTCMKYCSFLLGNTSSGIIEAASFRKYVINLGDRQKGRTMGKNVNNVPFSSEKILKQIIIIQQSPKLQTENIYYNGGATAKIVEKLLDVQL
ncbi:UDP-N-acetylglucosamine 2-epimerase [Reichenbachiella carrageenanivorans]|uniref:UDP-N-acetylglucosamine 2-epimerase n=1 Tax=Reichenbachiella carrageenanivorans TaxID=2979869 RepID=A0ABY6D3W9_9BACT|nr:UDP-N-acetylglucosamine 2-epimerase [Reichenbachiella carrageenanivorans]UXX80604.1 UDP-N-acetylglucosamine 2-epimerase [Reichenbachiella carrageenanivorans]